MAAIYTSPREETVIISRTAFVDDVNTRHNQGSSFNELYSDMLRDYNRWQQLLKKSEGKLSELLYSGLGVFDRRITKNDG
jgi:hypothetical protein